MLMSMPLLIGLMIVSALLFAGALACLGVWTYRDAKARGLPAGMWTAIVVLLPNLLGILLYVLVGRKQQKTACPACGYMTERGGAYCSSCGMHLGEPELPQAGRRKGTGVLMTGFVCIVLGFVLMIGVIIINFASSPESFTFRNVSIGQFQTSKPGSWKLSFRYLDGEQARSIKLKEGGSKTLEIDAKIESGTAEVGIYAKGVAEKRISLNGLDSPYVWDLRDYPSNAKLSLRLYADKAKGKVDMKWEQ